MKAPAFNTKIENGDTVTLKEFEGKKLILFFYPKDDTAGCTKENCNLRDNHDLLKEKGFELLGVSPDSAEKHRNFIEKYSLPFHLIADPEKDVINAYEVWGEKQTFGKTYNGLHRTTFVIDEEGRIEHIFKQVKTKSHTAQILDKIG